jgi:hypothetical protein
MFSRNNLLLLPAFLAVGLFAFAQTSLAEETIVPALSDVDNDLDDADGSDGSDDGDDGDDGDHSKARKKDVGSTPTSAVEMAKAVTENGTLRVESNNVFNEDFWAEMRDEGIVPAYGRNYYGGVSIKF